VTTPRKRKKKKENELSEAEYRAKWSPAGIKSRRRRSGWMDAANRRPGLTGNASVENRTIKVVNPKPPKPKGTFDFSSVPSIKPTHFNLKINQAEFQQMRGGDKSKKHSSYPAFKSEKLFSPPASDAGTAPSSPAKQQEEKDPGRPPTPDEKDPGGSPTSSAASAETFATAPRPRMKRQLAKYLNRLMGSRMDIDAPYTEASMGAPDTGFTFHVATPASNVSGGTWHSHHAAMHVPIDRRYLVSIKDLEKRMGEKTQLYSTTQRYGYDIKEMEQQHRRIDPIGFVDGYRAAAGKHIRTVTNLKERYIVLSHNAKATKKNIQYLMSKMLVILPVSFKVYFKIRKQWVLMSNIRTIADLQRAIESRNRGTLLIKITW